MGGALFFVLYNGKCWYLPFVCLLPAHIMVDVDYDDPLVRAPGEKYPISCCFSVWHVWRPASGNAFMPWQSGHLRDEDILRSIYIYICPCVFVCDTTSAISVEGMRRI